jgi:hypothetical protein
MWMHLLTIQGLWSSVHLDWQTSLFSHPPNQHPHCCNAWYFLYSPSALPFLHLIGSHSFLLLLPPSFELLLPPSILAHFSSSSLVSNLLTVIS